MREVFSKRLYNARRQAGLSQDQLVALIDGKVKKTAIAKYERGEMMAEPDVIVALAKALNQKFDYFFRPFTVTVSNVEFRAKASLGSRKEETLRHDIISRIERYLELKRLLNDNTTFTNPFNGRLVSTQEDAEQAAIELYEHWDLGKEGMHDVMPLLEDKGIAVIDIDADDSFDGYSAYVNGDIPVIVLRGKPNTTERRRFTALHEMAHLLFTFDENASKMEKERLCNRFAGAVLMPAKTLVHELGRYRSNISPAEMAIIKNRYGISAMALITRAFQLEVISKFTFIRLKDYITSDKLEMHIGSNTRIDKPTRFDLMLLHALSEELISVTKAADLAGLSLDELVNQYLNNGRKVHY